MPGVSPRARNIVLVAILVVTAFVVATVLGLGGTDGSDDGAATTTTTAPPTTVPPAPTTTAVPIVVPDGDYTEVCGLLEAQAASYVANPTPAGFQGLFDELDYDALVLASNDWLRPSIVTLREQRQVVVDALEGVEDPAQFDPATVPPAFWNALQQVTAVAVQKCGLG